MRGASAAALAAVLLAGCSTGDGPAARETAVVAEAIDGDTIALDSGERVRLVQIDAPELRDGECHAEESAAILAALLPPGSRVTLETDPALDDVDRFGRLLRTIRRDGTNVNLELVRRGAASVWFFEGDRGRHADELLAAARAARDAGRGLWGACPGTELDSERGVDTGG